MTAWTSDDLNRIATADELEMAPLRRNGTLARPVPIWVVRDGDDLCVRSFRGADGGWWRTARASHEGHIRSGGVDKDVTFVECRTTRSTTVSTRRTAPSTAASAAPTSTPWSPHAPRRYG